MKKPIPFHPLLFLLFPLLTVYSANIKNIPVLIIIYYASVIVLLAAACFAVIYAVLKSKREAALIVSFIFALVFLYGTFSSVIMKANIGGFVFSRNIHRVPVYLLLFSIIGILLFRARNHISSLTKLLNFVSIILIIFPVVNISAHYLVSGKSTTNSQINNNNTVAKLRGDLPDIYYIIPDGYAGYDTLREIYGYDNGEFIDYLRKKGFYVAIKSRSNYPRTEYSIPSSLGMNYHNEKKIIENAVMRTFEAKGYKYISLSDMMESGDTNFSLKDMFTNEFFIIIIRTTIIDAVAQRFKLYSNYVRRNVLRSFEKLSKSVELESPKFVFAHIMSPHPPYVFGKNGEKTEVKMMALNVYKTPWDDNEGYKNQLIYINSRLKETVDTILSKSKKRPIIIIQGDHGPNLALNSESRIKASTRIMNAYYLPADIQKHLYSSITPVNSFRVILKYYFNDGNELLPDRVFYAPFESTKFEDVTETSRQ
ncbi:MAG: hypothetical protein NT145_08405 [Elusimicrobia bacterium]|nr:hypothetical protein [Elusimicrobiota bacterium]